MKCQLRIDGTERFVKVERGAGGETNFHIDGRPISADAVEIGPDTFSILLEGRSFEVHVHATTGGLLAVCGGQEFLVEIHDPRAWRRSQGPLAAAEGRQQVAAPMPGKVVRVLITADQAVVAGQGLVVVEAMKMQNEIRAPKDGKVERVLVKEGDTVGAGQPLAVIV